MFSSERRRRGLWLRRLVALALLASALVICGLVQHRERYLDLQVSSAGEGRWRILLGDERGDFNHDRFRAVQVGADGHGRCRIPPCLTAVRIDLPVGMECPLRIEPVTVGGWRGADLPPWTLVSNPSGIAMDGDRLPATITPLPGTVNRWFVVSGAGDQARPMRGWPLVAVMAALLLAAWPLLFPSQPAAGRVYGVRGVLAVLAVGCGLVAYFAFVIPVRPETSDHLAHLRWAREGGYPDHFVYQVLVRGVFELRIRDWTWAAATVLATAVLLKWLMTAWLLARRGPMAPVPVLAAAGMCCLCAPLPRWWDLPSQGFGALTPVVWHNPTTILMMPVALAMVAILVRLRSRHGGGIPGLLAGGLAFLSVFIKPNLVMCLVPFAGLAALLRILPWRPVLVLMALAGMGTVAFVVRWQQVGTGGGGGIAISPFLAWSSIVDGEVAYSAASSLLFPVVMALGALVWTRHLGAYARRGLAGAWLLAGIALGYYILLVEPARVTDGNFFWGVPLAMHLVWVFSIVALLDLWRARVRTAYLVLAAACLFLHAVSGLVFFVRSSFVLPA